VAPAGGRDKARTGSAVPGMALYEIAQRLNGAARDYIEELIELQA